MQNGRAALFVNGRGPALFKGVEPSGVIKKDGRHALGFGDGSDGASGRFDLDFVRWTLQGARFDAPASPSTSKDESIPATPELMRDAAKRTGGPSVLFIDQRQHIFYGGASQKMFLGKLALEHGFRVAFREQEFPFHNRRGNVDPKEFRNYEALVYLNPAWPEVDKGSLTETFQEQWKAALDFVRGGGGLLYMPWVGEGYLFATRLCFQPLGLTPLAAIPVGRAVTPGTVMRIPFVYTTPRDAKHPILEGVSGLWIPVYHGDKAEV